MVFKLLPLSSNSFKERMGKMTPAIFSPAKSTLTVARLTESLTVALLN